MLETAVFLSGAVVMILELTGSRILAPYLGASLVVWTSLIGIILGALSLGYWWGGRLADREPSYQGLARILLLASIAISLIALVQGLVLPGLAQPGLGVKIGSVVSTAALFAPASVLLGMVSPYAARLRITAVGSAGRTVGRLYALSTLGSIAGTFAAGFILLAWLGSSQVIIAIAGVLVLAALLVYPRASLWLLLAAVVLGGAFVSVRLHAELVAEQGIRDVDTAYNRVLVYDIQGEGNQTVRVMTTSPQFIQTAIIPGRPEKLLPPYTRFFTLAPALADEFRRVLVIGGAGYAVPQYLLHTYPDVHVDVVEIDPGMTSLAREMFGLAEDPRLAIYHQDGRIFLNQCPDSRYDAVLVDAFTAVFSPPFHLTTLEAVKRIHSVLRPGGVVMLNLLSSLEGATGRFFAAELATYKRVFPQVEVLAVTDPEASRRIQSLIIAAGKTDQPMAPFLANQEMVEMWSHRAPGPFVQDKPLTDEFAPVDYYMTFVEFAE